MAATRCLLLLMAVALAVDAASKPDIYSLPSELQTRIRGVSNSVLNLTAVIPVR